jgi:hypothetical protein
MAGVDSERNQSLRRGDAPDLADAIGDNFSEIFIALYSDNGRKIIASGNRINLANAIDIGDCFRNPLILSRSTVSKTMADTIRTLLLG